MEKNKLLLDSNGLETLVTEISNKIINHTSNSIEYDLNKNLLNPYNVLTTKGILGELGKIYGNVSYNNHSGAINLNYPNYNYYGEIDSILFTIDGQQESEQEINHLDLTLTTIVTPDSKIKHLNLQHTNHTKLDTLGLYKISTNIGGHIISASLVTEDWLKNTYHLADSTDLNEYIHFDKGVPSTGEKSPISRQYKDEDISTIIGSYNHIILEADNGAIYLSTYNDCIYLNSPGIISLNSSDDNIDLYSEYKTIIHAKAELSLISEDTINILAGLEFLSPKISSEKSLNNNYINISITNNPEDDILIKAGYYIDSEEDIRTEVNILADKILIGTDNLPASNIYVTAPRNDKSAINKEYLNNYVEEKERIISSSLNDLDLRISYINSNYITKEYVSSDIVTRNTNNLISNINVSDSSSIVSYFTVNGDKVIKIKNGLDPNTNKKDNGISFTVGQDYPIILNLNSSGLNALFDIRVRKTSSEQIYFISGQLQNDITNLTIGQDVDNTNIYINQTISNSDNSKLAINKEYVDTLITPILDYITTSSEGIIIGTDAHLAEVKVKFPENNYDAVPYSYINGQKGLFTDAPINNIITGYFYYDTTNNRPMWFLDTTYHSTGTPGNITRTPIGARYTLADGTVVIVGSDDINDVVSGPWED